MMRRFSLQGIFSSILGVITLMFAVYPAYSEQETGLPKMTRSSGDVIKALEKGTSIPDFSVSPNDAEQPTGSRYFPKVWCGNIDDMKIRKECWKAFSAGFNYYESGLEHRKKVFWWQHISTRIIFFVVLGLVVTGIYFAWVQFKQDITPSSKNGEAQHDHEIEISTTGIKVSSPVLGVIILTLSLAFFYLYLVYVYPITEIF